MKIGNKKLKIKVEKTNIKEKIEFILFVIIIVILINLFKK